MTSVTTVDGLRCTIIPRTIATASIRLPLGSTRVPVGTVGPTGDVGRLPVNNSTSSAPRTTASGLGHYESQSNATQTTSTIASAHSSTAAVFPAAPPTPATTTSAVSTADSGHSLVGPVVGGTVGGTSLIALGVGLWLFARWRRKRLAEARSREKLAQSPDDSLPEVRETHNVSSLSNGHAGPPTRKIVISTMPNPFLDYQQQAGYENSSSVCSTDLASTSIRATVNSLSFRSRTDTDGEELWEQRTNSTTTYSDPFDLERPPSIVGS